MKNLHKGSLQIVIALLVGVILGAGGFYSFSKTGDGSQDLTPEVITKEEVTTQEEKDGRYIGFIKGFVKENGDYSLSIDYAQWVSPCVDCPNNFKILNVNPKIRTFSVSPSADVSLVSFSETNSYKKISLEKFKTIFEGVIDPNDHLYSSGVSFSVVPYWITLENGIVSKIQEQYLP